ncbi:MAG: 2-phospho-L-lactate guanylyltransferase [Actinomycetota bacterium]
MPTVAVIPVKSFALGKQRLAGALDPERRAALARGLADHVATTVSDAGVMPLIVTADAQVAEWATRAGFPSVADPGVGIDAAASAGVAWADQTHSEWLVLHADLPLIDTGDITALSRMLKDGPVIAPSSDGGTSAIGTRGPRDFSFGPASFHRHLKMLPESSVVARPGLLLDVDSELDLQAAVSAPQGGWIRDLVGGWEPGADGQNLY